MRFWIALLAIGFFVHGGADSFYLGGFSQKQAIKPPAEQSRPPTQDSEHEEGIFNYERYRKALSFWAENNGLSVVWVERAEFAKMGDGFYRPGPQRTLFLPIDLRAKETKTIADRILSEEAIGASLPPDESRVLMYRAVFEVGKKTMRNQMQTMTRSEAAAIDQNVTFASDPRGLSLEPIPLSEAVQADYYRHLLAEARTAQKPPNEIAAIERRALTILQEEILKYPWMEIGYHSSVPKSILQTKTMVCVGKSLLAHIFLQEWGIEHWVVDMPAHSALIVKTSDGREYFSDPTNLERPLELTPGQLIKKQGFSEHYRGFRSGDEPFVLQRHKPAGGMMSQMLHNMANVTLREDYQQYVLPLELWHIASDASGSEGSHIYNAIAAVVLGAAFDKSSRVLFKYAHASSERAVKSNPDEEFYWPILIKSRIALGVLHDDRQMLESASEFLKKTTNKWPGHEGWEGLILIFSGHPEQGSNRVEKHLGSFPLLAHVGLLRAYLETNKTEQARERAIILAERKENELLKRELLRQKKSLSRESFTALTKAFLGHYPELDKIVKEVSGMGRVENLRLMQ